MTQDAAAMSAPSAGSSSFSMPARWSFELPTVASHFDSHVREQLPFYDLATSAVCDLVRFYLQDGGTLLDIGASTGNITKACSEVLSERRASAVSIESSAEMVARFGGVGAVVHSRIEDMEVPPCDVAVSFLTLGFVPPKVRRRLIENVMRSVALGGAFICVERTEPSGNATASRLLLSAAKLRSGSPPGQVVAKELSIAGVLRPLSCELFGDFNPWLFFAYGDFRGYVIEVPE
jgi:tRNA (cmo5U34)-methyltransferase